MPRLHAGVTLGLALMVATGCGKPAPPAGEPAVSAPGVPATPPVANAQTPGADAGTLGADASGAPAVTPPVAGHQLDAAKQVVPPTPATGSLDGTPFTPTEVTLTGTELTFAVLKPGDAGVARSLTIRLPAATNVAAGLKLTVASEVKPGEVSTAPVIEWFNLSADKPSGYAHENGYALTLELAKREGGKQAGKLAVSLPDGAKSYLAGTFTAEARRAAGEPPGPDESPAVAGAVTIAGEPKGDLEVGLIGQPAGQVVTESVTLPVAGPPGRFSRTESPRPTTLALAAGGQFRYEHVKLPPGRYLVWARQTPGPTAWSWVTVTPNAVTDAPLTLDAKRAGKLTVTTTQPTGTLRLFPKDGDATPVPEVALGYALKLELPSDAKAFDNVPPGRYVLVGALKAGDEWDRKVVEVRPGETADVKLK